MEKQLEASAQFANIILSKLPSEAIGRLKLQGGKLAEGKDLEKTGDALLYLYFIESGMATANVVCPDGSVTSVYLCGNDSITGLVALSGNPHAFHSTQMVTDGSAYRCNVEDAQREFDRNETFRALVLRRVKAQHIETACTALCNTHHNVEERAARWLLMSLDRLGNGPLELTQEAIAQMLGAERKTVGAAIDQFRQERAVETTRGRVLIMDREALERRACPCYAAARDYLGAAEPQ